MCDHGWISGGREVGGGGEERGGERVHPVCLLNTISLVFSEYSWFPPVVSVVVILTKNDAY